MGIFATKFHAFGEARDTIDTATAYNNLACCLAALDRPVEATWMSLKGFHIFHGVAGMKKSNGVGAYLSLFISHKTTVVTVFMTTTA